MPGTQKVLSRYLLTILPISSFTMVVTEGALLGLWLGKGGGVSKICELFDIRTWTLITLNGGLQGLVAPGPVGRTGTHRGRLRYKFFEWVCKEMPLFAIDLQIFADKFAIGWPT